MPDPAPPPETADAAAEVVARPTEFAQMTPSPAVPSGSSLDSFRDVPITITARLGHTVLPIAEILKLAPGSVVELEEAIATPIELTVRGVPFATGEVVVVDDHFAIRIKTLLPPRGGKAT